MNEFPDFMIRKANHIDSRQQKTPDIDGYNYEGADGSQVCIWTYYSDRESKETIHDFDEYVICLSGEYIENFLNQEHTLHAGDELVISKQTPHHGRVTNGTRTIHVFGGRRIV